MEDVRLTPASYIVLGLIATCGGEATPYQLKTMVAAGLGEFWSLQHAQLYSEPERLAGSGYVEEEREDSGRRRRLYRLTDRGRQALAEWVAEPTSQLSELRDLGLLKLFFGADPARLAPAQLEAHRDKLRQHEELRDGAADALPPGARLTLEAGIGHEREWVRFWSRLAEE
jgi:DNA-binding PadR family transcriptional regulator